MSHLDILTFSHCIVLLCDNVTVNMVAFVVVDLSVGLPFQFQH
jgi:hypothetical protein